MSTNPTSLSERIARLNLAEASSSKGPAQLKSTGATGKISDRIKKFETGERALLPAVGGSFSFGGYRAPSSVRERTGRVASLGGGRANVPLLDVKQTRSVSASAHSGPSSPTTSITPPNFSPTIEISDTSTSTTFSFDSPPSRSTSALSGTYTPTSISSLDVETGSLASDAGRDLDGISTPTEASFASSPLSSPIIEAAFMTKSEADTFGALKGPVSALRPVRRTTSTLSVSSLVVERGSDNGSIASEGVADLKDVKGLDTPTGLDGKTYDVETFVGTVGRESGDGLGLNVLANDPNEVDNERARVRATNAELEKYEGETTVDVTAERSGSKDEGEEGHLTPVLSSFATTASTHRSSIDSGKSEYTTPMPAGVECFDSTHVHTPPADTEDRGYDDVLDVYESHDTLGTPTPITPLSPSMPTVKCSDCNADVDLLALSDHTCQPISFDISPNTPLASDTGNGFHSSATKRSRPDLDSFVAQTTKLVPDDVSEASDEGSHYQTDSKSFDDPAYTHPYDIYESESPTSPGFASLPPPPSTGSRQPSIEIPADIISSSTSIPVLDSDLMPTSKSNLSTLSARSSRSNASTSPLDMNSDDEDEYVGWATVTRNTR